MCRQPDFVPLVVDLRLLSEALWPLLSSLLLPCWPLCPCNALCSWESTALSGEIRRYHYLDSGNMQGLLTSLGNLLSGGTWWSKREAGGIKLFRPSPLPAAAARPGHLRGSMSRTLWRMINRPKKKRSLLLCRIVHPRRPPCLDDIVLETRPRHTWLVELISRHTTATTGIQRVSRPSI
jgi:hypothetical protein